MFGWMRRYHERQALAAADAARLIARFGESAYGEARRRSREARKGLTLDDNRPEGHWNRVRRIIGRKTRRDGLDTATRYIEDAGCSRRELPQKFRPGEQS